MRVVNHSYVLDCKVESLPHFAGRQCPLCASAMQALGNAGSGERIWRCENPACHFGYPVWWDIDEPMLTRLVRQRRQFIRAVELESSPMTLVHSTFIVTGALNQIPGKWRRCPVCCTGPLGSDGDMGLFAAAEGSRWWMCQRFEDCGFVYPFGWEEGETRLDKLVAKRQEFLRFRLAA